MLSKENIVALLIYTKTNAPKFLPFLKIMNMNWSDSSLGEVIRGAIVNCSRFNEKESILIMGDSAHSFLPPTGEGLNSGLEDAF